MFQQEIKAEKFYKLNWFNIDNPKNHWTEIPGSESEVNILETEIYLKGQKQIDAFSELLFKEPANENDMVIVDDSSYDYTIYINFSNYRVSTYVIVRNVNQLHASDLTIYPLITGKLSSQFGCISPDGARVSTYLYVQESTFQLSVSIELPGADLGSLPRMCFRQRQQF